MFDYATLRVAEARADYGSFKDSIRAPIHRWFMYPAGFSYRLIESKIQEYGLTERSTILDPFVGCGTTSVAAKQKGVNSIGLDAHPFVHWVAKTKLFWEYDLEELRELISEVYTRASTADFGPLNHAVEAGELPDLVTKCFTTPNLLKLLAIRQAIGILEDHRSGHSGQALDFLKLALTATLRRASWAGTGWPYIAPSKYHGKTVERDALVEFRSQVAQMYDDVVYVRSNASRKSSSHILALADARQPFPEVGEKTIDLVVTSPPYLNNYDYADRTRLELYFFGWAKSWRDISREIRDKLMMAATTQVTRTKSDPTELLSGEIREAAPHVYDNLVAVVRQLSKIRLHKGGKKSYDVMVAGYFSDIFKVIQQVYRILKPGADFVLVLGDSAPYGVYIPTDFIIGHLASSVGFEAFQVELLRPRGGKWSANTQRHKVGLRESIVTITK